MVKRNMGISKGKAPVGLFTVVFGIVCLMITGIAGYTFTQEMPSMAIVSIMIASIFTMWMVYVVTFTNLVTLNEVIGSS